MSHSYRLDRYLQDRSSSATSRSNNKKSPANEKDTKKLILAMNYIIKTMRPLLKAFKNMVIDRIIGAIYTIISLPFRLPLIVLSKVIAFCSGVYNFLKCGLFGLLRYLGLESNVVYLINNIPYKGFIPYIKEIIHKTISSSSKDIPLTHELSIYDKNSFEFRNQSQKLKKKKPIGFRNTKETCYMNSMMHALASSTKLIERMESFSSNDSLKMFIDVLTAINNPDDEQLTIEDTTEKLKTFMCKVQWNRKSQQDAFQLLSFFINSIQKEIKDNTTSETIPPKFRLLHQFSENRCFNKIQDHLALSVPLRGKFMDAPGVDLNYLLGAFFESSLIDDGENSTTMDLFEEAPPVMILHIQANEWSPERGEYIKPMYFIQYKKILDYEFNIHRSKDGLQAEKVWVQYRLVAVVQHTGDVGGGHYVTYRMHGDQWYLTNDEQVEEIPFNYDVVPYIMVYEKQ